MLCSEELDFLAGLLAPSIAFPDDGKIGGIFLTIGVEHSKAAPRIEVEVVDKLSSNFLKAPLVEFRSRSSSWLDKFPGSLFCCSCGDGVFEGLTSSSA